MPAKPGSDLSNRLEELTADSALETLSQARELLLEYGRFIRAMHHPACFGSLEAEAANLPNAYREQGGGCLLAWSGPVPAGFVAWQTLPASTAEAAWEMKRLWVRPSARGMGLGRALVQNVLDRARAAGKTAIYLDTAPESMPEAHAIYLKMGFTPCDPYNRNPVEGILWMIKRC